MACCAGLLMLLKKNISEFKIQIWDKEADNRIDKSTDTEPPNNFSFDNYFKINKECNICR